MGLAARYRDKVNRVKNHLTSLDGQPLGKAALVIIIFLDIFILVSIFDGLEAHTNQLSPPDRYIPGICREMVVNRHWNPTNRIDHLSDIIVSSSTSYYREKTVAVERHPVCSPYVDLFERIKNDKALVGIFEERDRAEREAKELQRELERMKGAYDTSLLEVIAKKENGKTKVEEIRKQFQRKTDTLNSLQAKVAALEQSINREPKVRQLWEKLQGLQEQDRQRLIEDLRRLNFWYPAKKLGMQMIFLLPLFAIFYAWNSASIRKNRTLQALVSAHLLVVSFIPIFFKIIETVYDIIPKRVLEKLIRLLESLKLVAVWHYLVIALAVAAALLLIYLFQKKLFSREKLIERRISKGECQQCGKRLPSGSPACPFCGFAQYAACRHCQKLTHVHGSFCRECGKAITESG